MKKRFSAGILGGLLLAAVLLSCASVNGPRPIGGIGVEQLKQMQDANAAFTLVDNRTEYEYKQGRIPGSINIPSHRFDKLDTLLPTDKKRHLVFYCRGTG